MSVPVAVLLAIAFGVLFGTVLAALAGVGSAVYRYQYDRSVPTVVVVVASLCVAVAGTVHLEVVHPSLAGALIGTLVGTVVILLTVYGHSQGDQLGRLFRRNRDDSVAYGQPLAAAVTADADSLGYVSLSPESVTTVDGFSPLEAARRRTLEASSWRLPADLPISALEARLSDRLETGSDFEQVVPTIDPQGTLTLAVAARPGHLAERVPDGWRAFTLQTPVPPTLDEGDRVGVICTAETLEGRVLGVDSDETGEQRTPSVTVAVSAGDAGSLLATPEPRLVVLPAGTTGAFEAVAALERAGLVIRRENATPAVVDRLGDTPSVSVLARRPEAEAKSEEPGWTFGSITGEQFSGTLLVAGPPEAIATVFDQAHGDDASRTVGSALEGHQSPPSGPLATSTLTEEAQ